jgi:CRISPR/Cas system-associated exonuclease Cas4 (RecB family)
VRCGFIYLVPQKRAQEVRITSNMRGWVHKALREIRAMLAKEATPPPTRVRSRCVDCEFRNLCPDVW